MEITNSCSLCSFSHQCDADSTLLLYPTTPIVGELLANALKAGEVKFDQLNEMFLLKERQALDVFTEVAKTKLSSLETDDIRIARGNKQGLLNAQTLTAWMKQTDTSWFDDALSKNLFTTFFQPIVDLQQKRVHGHECLVRLFAGRAYNGGEIMAAAVERGRTHVFDSYMRQLSVKAAAAQHQTGTKVFINFLPSSIYDPAFCMKSTFEAMNGTHLQPADIVFEVVESERVHDPRHLKKICTYYRKHGFGFALDDVGTGSNSLQMVCDLQPDYIKIDKSLISGLGDSMYRSTVGKIAELAIEFGVRVIAEGIEDAETAGQCQDLGIDLMQGYHFAKPAAGMVNCARDLANLAAYVDHFEALSSPSETVSSEVVLSQQSPDHHAS